MLKIDWTHTARALKKKFSTNLSYKGLSKTKIETIVETIVLEIDRTRLLRLERSASVVRSHGLPGLLGAGDLRMM